MTLLVTMTVTESVTMIITVIMISCNCDYDYADGCFCYRNTFYTTPSHAFISSLYYILDPFLFMSGIVVTALMS